MKTLLFSAVIAGLVMSSCSDQKLENRKRMHPVHAIEEESEYLQERNKKSREYLVAADSLDGSYARRAQLLDSLTDAKIRYLGAVETALIHSIEGRNETNWELLSDLGDYLEPTRFLIGDEAAKPTDRRFGAVDIHTEIIDHMDHLRTMLPPTASSNTYIPLNVTSVEYADLGIREEWIHFFFYHVSYGEVLIKLRDLKLELRQSEAIFLNTFLQDMYARNLLEIPKVK